MEAGAPALLALFDLNGFKAYNHSFGHPAGYALLARLGDPALGGSSSIPSTAT